MSEGLLSTLQKIKKSSYELVQSSASDRQTAIINFANEISENENFLLEENQKDLDEQKGILSSPLYERLKLSANKIKDIVKGMKDLAIQDDLVDKVLQTTLLDHDLILEKRAVPIGVIAVVFESRPDVIPQILSLMIKSANAVVLKGGKESLSTNKAFMKLLQNSEKKQKTLPSFWATLLSSREEICALLTCPQFIDLIIPRGGNEFVQYVMNNTKIPVLGHADGVCHIFIDENVDEDIVIPILIDAKTQYPAACNSVETLLVHVKHKLDFFPKIEKALQEKDVELFYPEDPSSFHTEFSDLKLNVCFVASLSEAIDHINTYGSHHTDCILSTSKESEDFFFKKVDSANVYSNCSTRFADGFRYGLGAEVGISTNKLHARGPVGTEGLLSYKYLLRGKGQRVASYVGKEALPFLHKKMK